MTFPPATLATAEQLLSTYRDQGLRLATAESCTGGLIAASLTEIAGSSDVVECGFVTYSNEAKEEMLGVPAAMIREHGAVSAEVAEAMAKGALAQSRADVAVSATGIAGPGGATTDKPVGLVFLGIAHRAGPARAERFVFPGDRQAVRQATLAQALRLLQEAAG